MAKNYGVIAASGKLTFDKSFARANGQPLDASEVYYSLESAKTYAKTDIAYIGQKIVVIEDNVVTQYYIADAAGTLEELGKTYAGDGETIKVENGVISFIGDIPTGDDKTIEIKDNVISLKATDTKVKPEGATEAVINAGAQLTLQADGTLKWLQPDTSTAEGQAAAIKALQDRMTAEENKVDKDTTYSVADGEKVLSLDGTEFATTLTLDYDSTNSKIQLKGIGGEVVTELDASAFVADGVLEDVSYDDKTKDLTFTWNIIIDETEDGEPVYKTDVINVSDLIDTYTAGDALELTEGEFNVKVKADDSFIEINANNEIATKGITEAINKAIEDEDLANKFNAKADKVTGATAGNFAGLDANGNLTDSGKKASDFALAEDVTNTFKNYTTTTDLTTLLNGKQDKAATGETYAYESYVDQAEADAIKTAGENADTKISDKVGEITGTVKAYVDGKENSLIGEINKVNGRIDDLGDLASKDKVTTEDLSETLNTKINNKADKADTLAGYGITDAYTQTQVTDAISAAEGRAATDASTKATQAKDDAIADAATKYATIGTVNELTQTVTNNANNRYTKAEVDAITGTPAEGKTLVEMIADAQTAATYDDTKVKEDIQKNADAIAAEVERATKAETALSDRIGVKAEGENASTGVYAYVDGVIKTVVEGVDATKVDSLNDLISWVDTHGGEVKSIKEDIENNTTNIGLNAEAIEAVEDRLDVVEPQLVKATLTEAEDGTVTATTGFITPEDNKFEMTDGKVTGVSTDLLFNGDNTLVLFGGSATA